MRPSLDCRPAVGAFWPPKARVVGQAPATDESQGLPCNVIPTERRVESFADDLNMRQGIVSGRVALLPRSTEIQPFVAPIRPSPRNKPIYFCQVSWRLSEKVVILLQCKCLMTGRAPPMQGHRRCMRELGWWGFGCWSEGRRGGCVGARVGRSRARQGLRPAIVGRQCSPPRARAEPHAAAAPPSPLCAHHARQHLPN